MTPAHDTPDQMEPKPLLHELLPALAHELEQCLLVEGENLLAGSIQTLQIFSACECSDITCGSFYTGPRPDGAFGPGHRSILLDPSNGMMILDVVDDVIRYVELIDRAAIHAALHSGSNLATKPLLLIDIDGVLSPFGGGLPPGFKRETIGSYEVIWSPRHQEWLFHLSQDFHLVWATTWEHSANESMSPILELGQLAVIEFDRGTGDTWKLPSVQEFIGNRPAAWIDDDLYLDAHKWAEQRDVPTLLIRTNSSVGLTKEHVDQLQTFAEHCRSTHRNP